MLTILGLYFALLAAALPALMIWQHHRGTHEFLSIRNLALVGFILFQLTSAAVPMLTGRFSESFRLMDPAGTGLEYAAKVTLFLIVLLIAYDIGWGAKWAAQRVPGARALPPEGSLLIMAVILSITAAILCVQVPIPLVGTVANYVGTGFAAIACGMIGWVWGKRLLNPALIALGSAVLLANLVTVAVGAFGRRGLVAVGACLIWGMYYTWWRHLSTLAMLRRLAVVSLLPLALLALYSSARTGAEKERTAADQITAVAERGALGVGIAQLISGQNTATVSMWIVENYPDRFEPRPLFTLGYFVVLPVPRDWWPDKPIPIAQTLARQARMPGVPWDGITIGPGIIGSASAEGGWYALVIYAIVGGLFLRLLDQIVIRYAYTPFVVLPVGAALGQIVGLARGETSLFANIYVISVSGAYASMLLIGKLLEWSGWRTDIDHWEQTLDGTEAPLEVEPPAQEDSSWSAHSH